MTLLGMDVLLVGQSFQTAAALSNQLRRWGFRCKFAGSILAACRVLRSVPVDVVLSDMHLSDGSGFRLLALLTGLPVSAFLCLPVESSCFWLPAIDAGRECLGSPALRPSEFANALEEMSRRPLPAAPAPNTDVA